MVGYLMKNEQFDTEDIEPIRAYHRLQERALELKIGESERPINICVSLYTITLEEIKDHEYIRRADDRLKIETECTCDYLKYEDPIDYEDRMAEVRDEMKSDIQYEKYVLNKLEALGENWFQPLFERLESLLNWEIMHFEEGSDWFDHRNEIHDFASGYYYVYIFIQMHLRCLNEFLKEAEKAGKV